jgi:copper-binding protein NosD
MRRPFLVALLGLALGASQGQTATITVSAGSSIKEAVSRMQGGDTVLIQAGTYREGNITPPSGTEASPTFIQGAPGAQVVLAPNDQGVDTIFDFQAGRHDIVLENLILEGDKKTAFPIYGAPDVARITVRNSTIRNGRQSGGLIGGTRWQFRNNDIVNNGVNCCATHSDDHGLYFSASYSQIVGNRFSGGACYNLQIYGGSNPTDNVIEDNSFTGSKCGVTLTHGANHLFKNNRVIEDGGYYGPDGLLIFAKGSKIETNQIVKRNIITVSGGDDASVRITGNTLCDGKIVTTNATLANNAFTCVEPPVPPKPPEPPVPPPLARLPQPLPAPSNFQVMPQP